MKKVMLTGDRPTGRLHVGHYVGSLRRRVELRSAIFFIVSDWNVSVLSYQIPFLIE